MNKGFGRWLFIEEGTLFDIKRYMQQLGFGESVVFVYTDPKSIEFDCRTPSTQQKISVCFGRAPSQCFGLCSQ